jgi:hypothetical protein
MYRNLISFSFLTLVEVVRANPITTCMMP